MELKKSQEANIDKNKFSIFFTGLMFALALTLIGWEWAQFEKQDLSGFNYTEDNLEDEMVPISIQQPPPPPPPQQQTQILEIVEDEEDVEEELEMEDLEVDEDTEIEVIEEEVEEVVEDKIFTIVEEQPEFPGGFAELQKYLGKNINYPSLARDAGISGTVYVTFVVGKDGSVSNAKVLRGIGGGCDKEALRVISKMPNWKPGKQRGKPVKVQYNVPVRFTLQ
ncbi:MAG: energy transducer TonB [Flavobacteriales bacterium]|nr:energy transducer TonB [Flavobacteriales bacterium]